jgi:hypothetical protein
MRLRALHSVAWINRAPQRISHQRTTFRVRMQHPRHALYAAWHSTLERHHEGTVSWVDIYDKSVKRPEGLQHDGR